MFFGRAPASACSLQVVVPRAVVLVADGRCHQGSSAVLHLFRHLRLPWPLVVLGLVVPVGLRDVLYDSVARRRQMISRWFDGGVAHQG
jgi:predicted DCC family thiol-disulfide oxidoreductase YuxK